MENNPGILIAELSDHMVKTLTETFDLEMEMLQANREKLPNGMTRYRIEIHSQEKQRMIKDFMMTMMFINQPINQN